MILCGEFLSLRERTDYLLTEKFRVFFRCVLNTPLLFCVSEV